MDPDFSSLNQAVSNFKQQQAESAQIMQDNLDAIADNNAYKAQQQAERDSRQQELLKLERAAAEREARRDQEQADAAAAERKRRRNELLRWMFTTLVALAGLVIAVIALVTR